MVQQCDACGTQDAYKLSWLEEAYLPQRIKSTNVIGRVLRNGHGLCDRSQSPHNDAIYRVLHTTKIKTKYNIKNRAATDRASSSQSGDTTGRRCCDRHTRARYLQEVQEFSSGSTCCYGTRSLLHDLCCWSFVPTHMYTTRFHKSTYDSDYNVNNVAANATPTKARRKETYFLYVFCPTSLGGHTETEYSNFTAMARVC